MTVYKKLLRSLREFKKPTFKTPMYVSFEVALEVIIPFMMAILIDYGIDDGNL